MLEIEPCGSVSITRTHHCLCRKISIALAPEMAAQLRQAVETGEYASSSEVIRDALRDWTHSAASSKTESQIFGDFGSRPAKTPLPASLQATFSTGLSESTRPWRKRNADARPALRLRRSGLGRHCRLDRGR